MPTSSSYAFMLGDTDFSGANNIYIDEGDSMSISPPTPTSMIPPAPTYTSGKRGRGGGRGGGSFQSHHRRASHAQPLYSNALPINIRGGGGRPAFTHSPASAPVTSSFHGGSNRGRGKGNWQHHTGGHQHQQQQQHQHQNRQYAPPQRPWTPKSAGGSGFRPGNARSQSTSAVS
jgi:hypothetical protein